MDIDSEARPGGGYKVYISLTPRDMRFIVESYNRWVEGQPNESVEFPMILGGLYPIVTFSR